MNQITPFQVQQIAIAFNLPSMIGLMVILFFVVYFIRILWIVFHDVVLGLPSDHRIRGYRLRLGVKKKKRDYGNVSLDDYYTEQTTDVGRDHAPLEAEQPAYYILLNGDGEVVSQGNADPETDKRIWEILKGNRRE